jgi:hypothetical protein
VDGADSIKLLVVRPDRALHFQKKLESHLLFKSYISNFKNEPKLEMEHSAHHVVGDPDHRTQQHEVVVSQIVRLWVYAVTFDVDLGLRHQSVDTPVRLTSSSKRSEYSCLR